MKKLSITFSILWMSFFCFSQKEALPSLEAYFSAIIVSDMDTSIYWYSNILGFEVLDKTESVERGFKQANLKKGNVLIELLELDSSVSQKEVLSNYSKKTKIYGFFKFGFLVSEFDKWIEVLKQAEVSFNGSVVTDHLSGKRMVIIKDPDGNRIQFFEK